MMNGTTPTTSPKPQSPIDGIYFSYVYVNGINFRLSSTIPNLTTTTNNININNNNSNNEKGKVDTTTTTLPLVLFLHGFPESWYSWRHQLMFLRNKPFKAVAPDMRGYGGSCSSKRTTTTTRAASSSPPKNNNNNKQSTTVINDDDNYDDDDVEDYTLPNLVEDVIGIATKLGYNNKFIVVGHDFGAILAWAVSLLYPDRILGVLCMSVPYGGTPSQGMLTTLQQRYGPCLNTNIPREIRKKTTKFHYVLYHCLPHADKEYDKNVHEFLYRIYSYRKGCSKEEIVEGTPEYDIRGLMFPPTTTTTTGDDDGDNDQALPPLDALASPGLWARIPKPKHLPNWLTKNDLNYYINEFIKSKFYGGLCWYRALDRNVELMTQCLTSKGLDDKVIPPSLFIVGEDDNVIKMYGGKEAVISKLKNNVLNQVMEEGPVFVNDCDHWIQQEQPTLVNKYLLSFLDRVCKGRTQEEVVEKVSSTKVVSKL